MGALNKLANLVELGNENWEEDIEIINKELELAGNDVDLADKKFDDLIKVTKVDLLIENGEKFNERFERVKADIENLRSDNSSVRICG